jgi:hypothetical protein
MRRICCNAAAILLVAILVLAYLVVVRGQTTPASDGRTAILLAPEERDLVLGEMRGFLVAVQTISQAIVDEDVVAAVEAARRVGTATRQEVPASLFGKLPLEFKQLGFDTHARFDQLALNTEQLGDASVALAELATLLSNCTACHAAFRFDLENP